MLKLYNTLTRKIEEFKPLKPPQVSYYSCGPTVYDFAHIGHARTYIFTDILQRALEFNGFKVKRVMNITDVGHLTSDADSGEDKMEKGAKREKKTVWEIAGFYTEDFFQMLKLLNIKKPEHITRATEYIPQMVKLISQLAKKGFTYKTSDGIYFDTSRLPDYAKLTGKTYSELEASLKSGARVEKVPGKKNITDFALWKLTPQGVNRQMEWDSPWGKGFPGWHIECSAMSMAILGPTLDIHTGGIDHISIHHTNEIAQSEGVTGKQFVHFWLHAGHLMVEGGKMSKSAGNFIRVADLIKKSFSPTALRLLFLSASYRKEMNFTWKGMEAAQSAYENLMSAVGELKLSKNPGVKVSHNFRQEFTDAVNEDLNMAKAVAVMWETLKSSIAANEKYDLLLFYDKVLGLDLVKAKAEAEDITLPRNIKELVEQREEFRKSGKFTEADRIRDLIAQKGFNVQDSPGGPIVIHNAIIKKITGIDNGDN
ncbi:cysteine--tRNA ligase [Candidatus Gottesmanbacteria bacterium RIFCSPLOWO2_02_FULL_42_29]|uniref:Cysteine--tRNA ligase n=2 Tax=Candidatus Gottesmaniibacteriota TaxID=1752720 RepID=A0A1F6BHD8_9BACT|nr:MAG: Cysteine-tRNA ligase [Candidatus Gottesmanbacteria bacterium GW2011_GWA2_42_18]KKS76278.1 MAG: Cysteine-tRNA ligase [Candidatus Gottesmanbacteria bacterium GW2011_GWC2_42_8]OGG12284.1 MAG: cysteine--tRNA ligase [Candidatus Gottesmanbacteria bacterium RIFCSPHIGHO2_01_FULL_42_27]OGG20782.1 MAG: cysteine--tRNA ligase [Candidatus Gottesmanbacteria bacterium RIFCSPHIGHO2_12_FULL_43_26]OGG35533.1 MAG: cysteine--tRNA ligase [Candidatus Gottesmanbacteria bacterium RIFCSPLOWO2_12_FULL_42_10]OGG